MKPRPKQTGDKAAERANPAQGSLTDLSPAQNLKPWEDQALTPEARLQAYKEFLREKISNILAATDRVSSDPAKVLEIRDDPETTRWVKEAKKLEGLSPQDFCHRIDYRPEVRELLGKNFLGAEAWRSQGIEVGEPPPIPATITTELLESDCPFHPEGKIKDTHLLVLIPKTVNGEPYSALKLDELCATRRGSGNQLLYDETKSATQWKGRPWAASSQTKSEWMLIAKSGPDFNKVPKERQFVLKDIVGQQKVQDEHYPEYRGVRTVELMTAVLLNDLVHGAPRMLDGIEYLRCVEEHNHGRCTSVGGFHASGLEVLGVYQDNPSPCVGVGLARRV
ncbi:MAG: hypothetical protein RL518_1026 [Pseudomonadota bacterium]|jgi:hypothetical protein